MDTKLMVDIATGVMEECRLLDDLSEYRIERFCEKLEAALKAAAPVEAAALTDEEIDTIGGELSCDAVTNKRFREKNNGGRMTVGEKVEYERLHRFARAIEARIKGQPVGGAT